MSKKIEFTYEEVKEMEKLRDDGYTYTEIGKKFGGVCWATISKAFKEYGIRSSHPSLTEDRKQEIVDLYLKYGIKEKVISELHTTYTTVSAVLSEFNIHQNTNGELTRHYTLNENYFDVIDTRNKAYFLGLLFADGCCTSKGYNIKISLQEGDSYILEMLNKELQSNREIKLIDYYKKTKGCKNQYSLCITNKHMWETLVSHGMIPNKSLKLKFPNTVPEELYKDFIRGYFDGDGHISKKWENKKIEIISNIDFCEYLQSYLSSNLNIKSALYLGVNKESSTRVLTISRKDSILRFLKWIYSGAELYMLRKKYVYDTVYLPKDNINNTL